MVPFRVACLAGLASLALSFSTAVAESFVHPAANGYSCSQVVAGMIGAIEELELDGTSAELADAVTLSTLATEESCTSPVSAFGENAACDEAKANLRQLEGLLRKQSEVVERLEGELAQARARVESLTGLILKLRQELAQIPAQINSALQQGNGVLAAYFQQRYTTGLTQLNRLIAERDALEVEIPVKEAALIAPQQARSRLEREVSMAREDVRSSCSH
jgi:hypothetical protein